MPDQVIVLARAKINLGLEIVGRRPDGYHDLVTILQEVELADRLTFEPAGELSLICDRPDLETGDNLVLRAARLLRAETDAAPGAAMRLEKRVPAAAGLGGGSSDAAATLLALNDLWALDLDRERLVSLARQLGADVPFFLSGGTQLATGMGDELTTLPTPVSWVVLVLTPTDLVDKTRRLYRALRPDDWSNGDQVRGLAEDLRARRSIDERALPSGFERPAAELLPELPVTSEAVRRAGGVPSLCGAGPTLLSVHRLEESARAVARALVERGISALVTRTVERPVAFRPPCAQLLG